MRRIGFRSLPRAPTRLNVPYHNARRSLVRAAAVLLTAWSLATPAAAVASSCGDGIMDPGEACDDGNNRNGDGCSAACSTESWCGNGVVESPETCDDGNNVSGDGCSPACTVEAPSKGESRHLGPVGGTRVSAPPSVPSGSDFLVYWAGPGGRGDLLVIADPGSPAGAQLTRRPAYGASPQTLRAPDLPGSYEVRYLQAGAGNRILAFQTIRVTPVHATLDVPHVIHAGGLLRVRWKGPGNAGDVIAIARRGEPGERSVVQTATRRGSPLTIQAPAQAGRYEVRYLQGQSKTVLAREVLTVTAH